MGQLLDKILLPKQNQLIYFGIIISFLLVYGLYEISFSWLLGFDFYVKIIYVILFFLLVLSFMLDKYNKTQVKRYLLVAIGLFTIYSIILNPIMDYLEGASKNQILLLSAQVDKYKQQKGKYPFDFSDKLFSNYSKRTYLGTKIFIDTDITEDTKDTSCYIHYLSLKGYTASFNVKTKQFHYYD